jgi:CBS domain-containing protein
MKQRPGHLDVRRLVQIEAIRREIVPSGREKSAAPTRARETNARESHETQLEEARTCVTLALCVRFRFQGLEDVMKVQDIMALPALTCPASMPLAAASRRMADFGCGTLVVLDEYGALAGIVTDRDLALAIGRLDTKTATVESVMTRKVHVCRQDDEISSALAAMSRHKVRRLPVVDHEGELSGMLSIDDIVLWGSQDAAGASELLRAQRCICSAESARLCDELAR